MLETEHRLLGLQGLVKELGLGIDEKAIQWFIRTYGVLHGGPENRARAYGSGRIHEVGSFDQEIAEVEELQYYLRLAWMGHGESSENPILHIECEVMNDAFKVYFDGPIIRDLKYAVREPSRYKYEKVVLATEDLWKLICLSFLHDFSAGKTGVCGNPNCPAPYYLKRRKDQKFCTGAGPAEGGRKPSADDVPDSGSCTAYAQREYARNWWRENRQGTRAKKGSRSPRRKRK